MEIDVKLNGETKFSNLKSGDTFSFRNNVWMKLKHTVRVTKNGGYGNAVSLEYGSVAEFDDDDKITLIKTKLVNA